MGKREKSLKGGNSASSRTADDCSTPEPYSCSGNFVDDFSELWLRSGLEKAYIPVVRPRPKFLTNFEETQENVEDNGENFQETAAIETYTTTDNTKILRPNIQVEFEVEETKQSQINYAKEIYIRSWKIESKIINVLQLCMLDRLQSISFWNVGLTESSLKVLVQFLSSLPSLKSFCLDGNPMPDSEPFDILLTCDSLIQHLSLKNNKISDKGALNIGKALSNVNVRSPLLSLNLGFNHISDAGAIELAKGLRMNRTLLSLSLASNLISDAGCQALAGILQRFSLTHEEVVARRKLISQHGLSTRSSSAPLSRRGDIKERPNSNKSGSLVTAKGNRGSSKKKQDGKKADAPEKTPKKEDRSKKAQASNEASKGAKGKKSAATKEGAKRAAVVNSAVEVEPTEPVEFTHPLLDPMSDLVDGKVYISGCLSLINLNLSGNKIGGLGLKSLSTALHYQCSRQLASLNTPGLLKLSLERNLFPLDHPTFGKLKEIISSRNPLNKSESPDDEQQSIAS